MVGNGAGVPTTAVPAVVGKGCFVSYGVGIVIVRIFFDFVAVRRSRSQQCSVFLSDSTGGRFSSSFSRNALCV